MKTYISLLVLLTLAISAMAAEKILTPSVTVKALYTFANSGTDGRAPYGALAFDKAGNLYGTTAFGGSFPCDGDGCGTVFKLTPNQDGNWSESVIHNFDGTDGKEADSNVTFDAAGNIYGVTVTGGPYGFGSAFQLTPNADGSWTENVLHYFGGSGDGWSPSSLTLDAAGNVYGTTGYGGPFSGGTVFELSPAGGGTWTETLLHSFRVREPAYSPTSAVAFDQAGNLYGTLGNGGSFGEGAAFELTPNGDGTWSEQIIHNFKKDVDGFPGGNDLAFDQQGNLYGTTTQFGGANGAGQGTVYRLLPQGGGSWNVQVLHVFKQDGKDGNGPESGVLLDSTGSLIGTTSTGGTGNFGTVYQLRKTSLGIVESVLSFHDNPESSPLSGLIKGPDGNLYGTTSGISSNSNRGCVYEIIR